MTLRLVSVNRCFAFVDESGDLGFTKHSSRFVTLAAVLTHHPEQLERIPQRIRKRRLKKSIRRVGELKFHNSSPAIRKTVLEMLMDLEDARIVSITARKALVVDRQKHQREWLYPDMAGQLVEDVLRLEPELMELHLVFDDRPFESSLGGIFDEYIRTGVCDECRKVGRIAPDVFVSRLDSLNSRGLQVADFVAGAINRKHESGDASYCEIIRRAISIEKRMFF
jgi:hypothetical protein